MTTIPEWMNLNRELKQAKEAEEKEMRKRIGQLQGQPIKALSDLREYWESQRKKKRAVDEVTTSERIDAELWLKVIDQIMSNPKASEPSGEAGKGEDLDNMDARQAAKRLNISLSTLYKLTHRHLITHTTVGGKKLSFTRKDIEEYLSKYRRPAKSNLDEEANRRASELLADDKKSRTPHRRSS